MSVATREHEQAIAERVEKNKKILLKLGVDKHYGLLKANKVDKSSSE